MEKKEEKKSRPAPFSEVRDKRGQETDAVNDFRKKIEMEITEGTPGLCSWRDCIETVAYEYLRYRAWRRPVIHWRIPWVALQAMTGRDYAVPTVDGTIHYLKAGKTHPKSSPGRRKYRMVMHFRCANARFMMIRETLLASATMTYYHLRKR